MLKSVNCDRISFGLESGNEEYRKKVLTRHPSNEKLLKCFEIISQGKIAFSVNNIIGFPDETREMIFETIEMNRAIKEFDSLTVSIFTPYHGTKLRELAVQRGYLQPDVITKHTTSSSLLKMPQLTSEEIDRLMRTFALYVKFPREEWPRISLAEQDTEEGNRIFEEYHQKYQDLAFRSTQDGRRDDWEDPTEYAVSPFAGESKDEKPWGWNCGAEQRKYVVPPREMSG